MVAVPADIPLTKPDELIVATALLLVLHVPPAVASTNWVELPIQTSKVPVIDATVGKAFTVISAFTVESHPFRLVTL